MGRGLFYDTINRDDPLWQKTFHHDGFRVIDHDEC